VLHPAICAGDGYPSLALRLYEPEPVPPQRMVEWGVLPAAVMESLLAAVSRRLRVLVVGGTGTGKTTLLSALCHGIPPESRLVKVEDPEEIWLPHPNVTTLEARPAPPGSDVPAYTVSDGVDDAMRLAPTHVIVGEVRTGSAALSLFRALMSDHAGLTTFHAEGAEEAVFRLGVILFADAGVRFDAARGLFAQAIDLVVQVGWQEGRRRALGVWEVAGLAGEQVRFRTLWQPGETEMVAPSRVRRH
jgi:pilus assembly protein CpaF